MCPALKDIQHWRETIVYAAALLFGPFVSAFAGGVGSMLADVSLAIIAMHQQPCWLYQLTMASFG